MTADHRESQPDASSSLDRGTDPAATRNKLDRYRDKRDFGVTSEPSGASAPGATASEGNDHPAPGSFVVQRHRARRLHYDFRLLIDGVLTSWSVPKGPTLDPSVKRLAIRVEDHPIEYSRFEGVIPAGEYGAGDVIVWDEGHYELSNGTEPGAALAAGELHLVLDGTKLHGHFMLVRTSGRGQGHGGPGSASGSGGQPGTHEEWLLFHKRDGGIEGWDPEQHPVSVKSGRTNDEVAARPDSTWTSSEAPGNAETRVQIYSSDTPELQELDGLGKSGTWRFAGRDLHLTNLDKVIFPSLGDQPPLTKRDLIRHFARFAPLMVRQLKSRPVNLNRFPDGVNKKGFWNKAVPKHAPDWIERWENPNARPGETSTYFVASEEATIAWFGNYGAVELHPWTSTAERPLVPSFALFDLDPGDETRWEDLVLLAQLHRAALDHLGVTGFPSVSGQSGIQIRVPVLEDMTFDQTRAWVESISRAVGEVEPDLVSWKWNVKGRAGLARLDYTQNAVNKTLVAPYSPRPAAGAPVSTPITWDELDDPELRPDRWTIRTIADRVEAIGDLLSNVTSRAQNLPAVS